MSDLTVEQGERVLSAQLLAASVEAAMAAAKVIERGAAGARTLALQEKAPKDFVTEVDREAEAAIATVLTRHFASALIVGEELSPDASYQREGADEALAFIVDPLDGTTNYLHGYPEYAVSIAAARAGRTLAAVVLNVPAREMFTATAGGGAFRNGERIGVSSNEEPARALVGTGFPFKHPNLTATYMRQFRSVLGSTSGIRRAGSAALDLADVACGRFDCFWELRLAPWDFAAGSLLVAEAGGVLTDVSGNTPELSASSIVAGNSPMHRWLITTLHDATDDRAT